MLYKDEMERMIRLTGLKHETIGEIAVYKRESIVDRELKIRSLEAQLHCIQSQLDILYTKQTKGA